MIDRISLILKAKNITPAQMADEIGVQRSGISHILNGRNKPSLDFVHKLIKRYPDISINWIMFGEGPMMINNPDKNWKTQTEASKQVNQPPSEIDLFKPFDFDFKNKETETENDEIESSNEHDESVQKIALQDDNKPDKKIPEGKVNTPATINKISDTFSELKGKENKKITRIVIFYDDKSFTEYIPSEE